MSFKRQQLQTIVQLAVKRVALATATTKTFRLMLLPSFSISRYCRYFIADYYIKMMRNVRLLFIVILTVSSVIQSQLTIEQSDNNFLYEEWNTLANELSLLRTKLRTVEEILSNNAAGWCEVINYHRRTSPGERGEGPAPPVRKIFL